jgi:hypothetical protein
MAKSKNHRLPQFGSVEKLARFFDSHDMGEFWEQLPAAVFDVDLRRQRYLVAIDEQLMDAVAEIARVKHTSAQRLIQRWLKEKIVAAG